MRHDLQHPLTDALGEQSRAVRQRSFSRRALLEWSLPTTALGLVIAAVPLRAMAGSHSYTDGDYHMDYADASYGDHSDGGS